jgi:hypothetical protein
MGGGQILKTRSGRGKPHRAKSLIIIIIADIHPCDARRKAAVRASGDALEKRWALMDAWGAFLGGNENDT